MGTNQAVSFERAHGSRRPTRANGNSDFMHITLWSCIDPNQRGGAGKRGSQGLTGRVHEVIRWSIEPVESQIGGYVTRVIPSANIPMMALVNAHLTTATWNRTTC
jgi:hypothetical protein